MSSDARREAIENLSETLAGVSEALGDMCQDLLLDALHGATDSVRVEKEVQKARRAVAKAEQILRGLSRPTDD